MSTVGSLYDVLIAPINTEKSTVCSGACGKYVFIVHRQANKSLVRRAIEKIFEKKVKSVNIINVHPKTKVFKGIKGRRAHHKKAIVTLQQNESFEFLS
ncbi:50S ribosomal protein L23 [Alphaproteobacteria bacterium]